MKINWARLWKEFDKWCSEGDKNMRYPGWPAQARKIRALVEAQLKKSRRMR
jgi:hypothetical protein